MSKITNKQLREFVHSIDPYKVRTAQITTGNATIDVEIKPLLTVDEFSALVRSAADAVFDETGYRADIYKYALRKAYVAFYTNLGSNFDNDTLNVLIYSTNLIEEIDARVDAEQMYEARKAVDAAIEYRCEMLCAEKAYGAEQIKNTIVAEQNELMSGIENLLEEVKDFADSLDPNIQKESLAFMKHVNDMDEKELADNLISFNRAAKLGDSDE